MKLAVVKILKNTMALGAARVMDVTVMLLMVAVISRHLGPERYGEYAFAISLGTFLVALTFFGIERITIRNIASSPENADTIFGTALVARWTLSLIAMAILLIIVITFDYTWEIKLALFMTAVSQLALASANMYGAVFKAFERMEYETFLTFLFQLMSLGLVVAAVKFGMGFLGIFAALAMSNIGRFIASMILCYRKFLKPKFVTDKSMVMLLMKESFILGVNLLIVQALLRADIFLLKGMKNSVEVSYYYAPHSLLISLQVLPVALSTALFPYFSRLAQNNLEGFSYGYSKVFKLLWIVSGYMAVAGFFLASTIITLIYGNAFIGATTSFQILMPAVVFLFLHPLLSFVLISRNRHALLIPASAGALAVDLSLALLLIPRYGNVGASIASVAGYAVLFAITMYLVTSHVSRLSMPANLLKPLGALALSAATFYFLNGRHIAYIVLGASVVYAVSLVALKTFSENTNKLLTKAMRRI